MILIYIILAIVITVILMIVLFVIIHDWKVKNPRTRTIDEIFPDRKEDIPVEELEQLQKNLIEYLRAWGMDERAEIDENTDTKDTGYFFHTTDPAWDAIFLWSIGNSSREYLKVSSNPTIEEFATLLIKSDYENICDMLY